VDDLSADDAASPGRGDAVVVVPSWTSPMSAQFRLLMAFAADALLALALLEDRLLMVEVVLLHGNIGHLSPSFHPMGLE